MTKEISTSKTSVFDQKAGLCHYSGTNSAYNYNNRTDSKRYITYRWCSRLAASKLPGADLAVEYLYSKYIKNLSVSTIKQSGRIVLYFLHFLERDGTTIFALTRQDISAYVGYEQDRGLKTQSVVNHLRSLYAFLSFLIDQGVLPEKAPQTPSSDKEN